MNTLDFNQLTPARLEAFAGELLNQVFSLNLVRTKIKDGSGPVLWQGYNTKSGKGEETVIAEVRGTEPILQDEVPELVESIISYAKDLNPNRFFYVAFSPIDENVKGFFRDSFSRNGIKVDQILDATDINNNASSLPDLVNKYFKTDPTTNTSGSTGSETEKNRREPPPKSPTETDNIPFHLDQVAFTDKLKRTPVAKRIARSLNEQVFATPKRMSILKAWPIKALAWVANLLKLNWPWLEKYREQIQEEKLSRHAFMIHLQGAWGDGKSTFMGLIRNFLTDEKNKWIVIDFNAWQNQHVDPPWWSLINQIYKKSFQQLPIVYKLFFMVREFTRRVFDVKFKKQFIVIAISGVLMFWTYKSIPKVVDYFQAKAEVEQTATDSTQKEKVVGADILDFGKTAGALVSLIGLFYGFAQFLVRPLFLSSPESAKRFAEKVDDPMIKVKKHFEAIVDNLEVFGYRVAILVDDVDRCNAEFTVKLLEGIQTLYKDRKVLYIVAGDRHWISNCFETHYEKFSPIVKEPGQKLGYLFLEKAFQLSVRLPHITEDTKKEYWEYILNPGSRHTLAVDPVKEEEEKKQHKAAFEQKFDRTRYNEIKQYTDIANELGLSEEQVTDLALDSLSEDQEDIKHLLQNHYDLIESNPRSIKRLANQYNIYRDILIAERRSFNRDKLFRWVVLQNVYPMYTDYAEMSHDLLVKAQIPKELTSLLELAASTHWQKLVVDKGNKRGGKIVAEDIETFVGFRRQLGG